MLQQTRNRGMSGQPTRWVKADDRLLQVGGQHQKGGYTTQSIQEVVARNGGWGCVHQNGNRRSLRQARQHVAMVVLATKKHGTHLNLALFRTYAEPVDSTAESKVAQAWKELIMGFATMRV